MESSDYPQTPLLHWSLPPGVTNGYWWRGSQRRARGGWRCYLLCGQVAFVSHKKLIDIFTGVPLDLLQPLLDVRKWLLVCDIIHDNNAVRTAVVTACYCPDVDLLRCHSQRPVVEGCAGNSPKALLTSSVPNLQLDGLAIKINGPNFLWQLLALCLDTKPPTNNQQHGELTKSTPIVLM